MPIGVAIKASGGGNHEQRYNEHGYSCYKGYLQEKHANAPPHPPALCLFEVLDAVPALVLPGPFVAAHAEDNGHDQADYPAEVR